MQPMLRRTLLAALAFVVAWHSCELCAIADEPDDLAEARKMANAAADDLEASHFDEALKKAERAEQLYHAPPHVLMIAEANEGLGRLVEALETYERLAAEPLSPTAPAVFRKAREIAAKNEKRLLSRVPSILVDVIGAPVEDAKASVDGRAIPLGGVASRVNPGKHTVHVEADGFKPLDIIVVLAERGGAIKVPANLEVANARRTPDSTTDQPKKETGSRTLVAPTIITLGIGAAALTTGIVTGVMAFSNVSELEKQCAAKAGGNYGCPINLQPVIDQTQRLSQVSTATFIVGGLAVGVGITLLFLGKPQQTNSAFHIEPILGLGGAGIRGRF
jgi:hypothetical protein